MMWKLKLLLKLGKDERVLTLTVFLIKNRMLFKYLFSCFY